MQFAAFKKTGRRTVGAQCKQKRLNDRAASEVKEGPSSIKSVRSMGTMQKKIRFGKPKNGDALIVKKKLIPLGRSCE